MEATSYGPLGEHIIRVSQVQGFDALALKRQLGVSTDLFWQLLYYGAKPEIHQPKPGVLRRVARLLNTDERKLLSLAGYKTFDADTVRDFETKATTLGELLENTLHECGMSGNQLAELAGISQGTVRNLLKQREKTTVPGPHPKKLKAVCEVLNLSQLKVFQLAGYISPDDLPQAQAETCPCPTIVELFAALPPEKQQVTLAQLTKIGSR